MAYNPYFTQFYQGNPYIQPQMPQQMQQQQIPTQQSQTTNGITWVQGESAAKSYPVAPGNSILLMDSENSVMYIKSTDQSGMPQPLRIFDYTERKASHKEQASVANETNHNYVSHEELDAFKSEFELFRNEIKDELKKNAPKPAVRKPAIKED